MYALLFCLIKQTYLFLCAGLRLNDDNIKVERKLINIRLNTNEAETIEIPTEILVNSAHFSVSGDIGSFNTMLQKLHVSLFFLSVSNIKKWPRVNKEMRSKLTKSGSHTEATDNGSPSAPVPRLELDDI